MLRPCTILALGMITLALAGHALAQTEAPWLAEAEIRAELAGRTIDGKYPDGDAFTETYEAGGRVHYEEGEHSTAGRWSITEGTLCTIYDNDPTGGCFRVLKTGSNCFEFYFVARNEYQASSPRKPDWAARGWIKGKAPTCAESDNV